MSLKYAIVDYPIKEELLKSGLIPQTNATAIVNNSRNKCIVSFQDSYNFTFRSYPTMTQSELNTFLNDNQEEWNNDLKPSLKDIDSNGRQVVRSAATTKGWRYLAHSIELTTSKINSCVDLDWAGNTRNYITCKFFNSDGDELNDQNQSELDSNCVKTVVTFKPDFDYDIIGGHIHQHTTPTSINDVRLWVIGGAPELGSMGIKEFVSGLNMKFMGINEQIETDGRATARMKKITEGVPYQTNQLQYIITHPVGYQHELMLVVEYFKE